MCNILTWIFSLISAGISFVAIVVSAKTAQKQRNVDKRIALYNKRYELIHLISEDKKVGRIDMELCFPKCMDAYESFIQAGQNVKNANFDIEEYFDYLSESNSEQVSKEDLKIQFKQAEIKSYEANDDSFEEYCHQRELCYKEMPDGDFCIRNYFDLSKSRTEAEESLSKSKSNLLDKMKQTISDMAE